MASGIDWFRWHHGSVTDPKFKLVARRAGVSLPDVIAVWAFVLEKASAAEDRGSFGELDCEAIDCLFGIDDGKTAAILEQMGIRGLVDGGRITAWEKRQPKREREDTTAAERQANKRARDASARQSAQNDATATRTPMPDDFAVSERVQAWAAEKGYENLGAHLEAFKAKVQAKGYSYVDWDAAFMEAIREDWAKLRGHGAAKGQAPPPERAANPWWETGPGIRAKGKELGIGDWREGAEQWYPYANAVFQAAKKRGELPEGVRL